MTPLNTSSFNFVRAYVAILLGIVLVGLLLEMLLAASARDEDEAELSARYAPLFSLLGRELEGIAEADMPAHIDFTMGALGVPVSVIPLSSFADTQEFATGQDLPGISVFYDSNDAPLLYQPIAATDLVLALGPLPVAGQSGSLEVLVISAYYALIALVVLLWIRPFYRDLSRLRRAAAEFGKQDFSTRVQLDSKSSILPVAQSFNSMAERIEYLVSAHRELTNAVSHELRTPLARFKFSLEILARSDDAGKRQQYLENMKTDVVELEGLIDEMLSYARLSEQNLLMNLVEVDLRAWLQQELTLYAAAPVRIVCSFAIQPSTADYRSSLNPELMARAIHNIIRNGLRYARAVINVHAQLNEEAVTIRICDDGPGIPAAMHEKIFEPFSRLETSRDKVSGGYGLGLAIAARILHRHQGTIRVQNCEPNGACFFLSWPRNRTASTAVSKTKT